MLDTRYVDCDVVTLVMDNLNTHTKGAFYGASEPDKAKAYPRRLKFWYMPQHGSRLNLAECERNCLTRQCLRGRRIGELEVLQSEIVIWSQKTNAKH